MALVEFESITDEIHCLHCYTMGERTGFNQAGAVFTGLVLVVLVLCWVMSWL